MSQNDIFRKLPAVDKLLLHTGIKEIKALAGEKLTKYAIRKVLDDLRNDMSPESELPTLDEIVVQVGKLAKSIYAPSLRSIINGSGIILHTNLGRAPLGENLLEDVSGVLSGYNNLEFNIEKGKRGERNAHSSSLIKYLTGAEDIVVVNNNAAAVFLILTAFGKRKEAIVSRGELIEIGGSFRIPDIMKTSGCKMVEVGATNKTKLSDYKNAITDKTSILFKAHRSNYVIKGFMEELSLETLAALGKEHDILSVYDIGSGLLRKVDSEALKDEPDVQGAIASGVDLVCFSGDKLLGAAQAGIIAGKKKYIDILKKHPLMRALRVCKTTLAVLEKACSYYLDDDKLFKNNILFSTLNRSDKEIQSCAYALVAALEGKGINASVSASEGQYGGGTLPDLTLKSYQVKIGFAKGKGKEMYHKLLNASNPVLTNLKSGNVYVDMLCVKENDLAKIVESIVEVI